MTFLECFSVQISRFLCVHIASLRETISLVMKKILCIGEALIDMICTDKGVSLSEGQHFLKKPGGAPTNVAAAIGALGGNVELVARVGNDPFGQQLIDVMQEFSVSTRWIVKDEEHFTTTAFVSLMENGERDFVFNRGADGYLGKDDLLYIDLTEFSIVHFGSATAYLPGALQTTYQYHLQSAMRNDILISFDPNYRPLLYKKNVASFINQAWNFLDVCHFAKLSEEEAILMTGRSTAADAALALSERINAVFVITLGEKGSLLRFANTTEIIPGIKINPVDTTGAGDAFVGAVLYQLNKYSFQEIKKLGFDNWKEIIFNANKAGAYTAEHLGAMEAFKYLSNRIF